MPTRAIANGLRMMRPYIPLAVRITRVSSVRSSTTAHPHRVLLQRPWTNWVMSSPNTAHPSEEVQQMYLFDPSLSRCFPRRRGCVLLDRHTRVTTTRSLTSRAGSRPSLRSGAWTHVQGGLAIDDVRKACPTMSLRYASSTEIVMSDDQGFVMEWRHGSTKAGAAANPTTRHAKKAPDARAKTTSRIQAGRRVTLEVPSTFGAKVAGGNRDSGWDEYIVACVRKRRAAAWTTRLTTGVGAAVDGWTTVRGRDACAQLRSVVAATVTSRGTRMTQVYRIDRRTLHPT